MIPVGTQVFDKPATHWIHGPCHLFPPLSALSRDGNWFREGRKRKRRKDEPWYSSRGIRREAALIYTSLPHSLATLIEQVPRGSAASAHRLESQSRLRFDTSLRLCRPTLTTLNPPLTRSNAKNTSPYTNVESKFHRRWTNFDKIPVYPPLNPRLIIFHVGDGIADDEESPETFYTQKEMRNRFGKQTFLIGDY